MSRYDRSYETIEPVPLPRVEREQPAPVSVFDVLPWTGITLAFALLFAMLTAAWRRENELQAAARADRERQALEYRLRRIEEHVGLVPPGETRVDVRLHDRAGARPQPPEHKS